jgi:crossover junction endodeoxyribonuclease RusA
MIALTLPLPPTINHYFARNGSRTYLPAKVREYRKAVADIVADARHQTLEGRLSLFVAVYPATKAKTDLDNRAKGLQDALTHAGVWMDDEQIDQLIMVRREVIKGGQVKVVITELTELKGAA